ncbi:MAG TPA: serine hydrolase, partial [Bacteroidia bacterium]|nr:serine hydrolase [Bacteroidia bacterium]
WKAIVYNFADIDDLDIFPSRIVKTSAHKDWALSADYNKKNISGRLLKELEDFKSVAFLVTKNDSICYERYWDGYSDSSLSNSFSMAKSIIGVLTGIALDEGKIKSLDQPARDFITKFKEGANAQLTIRHLLTMSSGLDWDESYSSLTSKTTEEYYGTRLNKQMSKLKMVSEPGKIFDYMSCNTQLLAMVLKKATGKTVSEYASEKLWTPLNAMHDAEWSLDHKNGNEKAYCCFYSNARDFARFGKLYLDSGRWYGSQIVSEKYVLESIVPAPLLDNGTPNKTYGYHWWVGEEGGEKIFYARGLSGQYIIVIPGKKIIIVRLGHKRDKTPDGILRDVPVFVEEVLKMYS